MKKYKILLSAFIILCLWSCEVKEQRPLEMSENLIANRLDQLCKKAVNDLDKLSLDSKQIPRALNKFGGLEGTESKSWTSGFYPGTLWQLYDYSKNPRIKKGAEDWMNFVEKEKKDSTTHDLGFKIYCSFGHAWRIEQQESYKSIINTAANTLASRYSPITKAIRSWDHNTDKWDFPVIIDNMMNLELLFKASRLTPDSSLYRIAHQHAITTMMNHFRKDHSSFHVIDFNPSSGVVRKRNTHQGIAHESAWSRGQAWGLYGFTVAYRETKDPRFLQKAIDIAHFFFQHPNLPKDHIPYWDFNAKDIPNAPRDVSAAVIAASGLLELLQYDIANKDQYLSWADAILLSLEQAKYQSLKTPFFLSKSVGHFPHGSEINTPIVYADYYYVEALRRRSQINN